jgi:hypothetical protein
MPWTVLDPQTDRAYDVTVKRSGAVYVDIFPLGHVLQSYDGSWTAKLTDSPFPSYNRRRTVRGFATRRYAIIHLLYQVGIYSDAD